MQEELIPCAAIGPPSNSPNPDRCTATQQGTANLLGAFVLWWRSCRSSSMLKVGATFCGCCCGTNRKSTNRKNENSNTKRPVIKPGKTANSQSCATLRAAIPAAALGDPSRGCSVRESAPSLQPPPPLHRLASALPDAPVYGL